jgi:hypothetical protein
MPVQRIDVIDSIGETLGEVWGGVKQGASDLWDWLNPKTFDDLAEGGINTKNAPDKITLPKELQEGMQKGWEGSFPDGKSQEQGGILVQDEKGNYKWKAGTPKPISEGGSGSFKVNRGDVGKGETLVGSGHTHPYTASEGGYENVTFSGGDLANLITNPENFKMVQSGKGQFVAAKTEEFNEKVKDLDDEGKKKMRGEMISKYDDVYKNTKGTEQERWAAAAKAVSDEYGIAYYEGSGGELVRQ